MFAGKSTLLIRLLKKEMENGKNVIAVKPSVDTRYHQKNIVTHAGESLDGRTIDSSEGLAEIHADLIGLDEAHFLRDNLAENIVRVLDRGISVICAGLDRTSFHVPFDEMGRLLCEADEIIKLTGECSICGEPATHTKRLVDNTEDLIIGGEGMFEPRCRRHRDV